MGRRKDAVKRVCLRCRKSFNSQGDRLCDQCNQVNQKVYNPSFVNTKKLGIRLPEPE